MPLSESTIESATLDWLGSLGYSVGHGPDFAPGGAGGEREAFTDVVLVGRLRDSVERLNAGVPAEAREEAVRKALRIATPSLVHTNRVFQAMLRDGVEVEYPRADGSIAGDRVRLDDVLRGVPTEHTPPLANLACAPTTTTLACPDSLQTVIKDPVNEEAIHGSAVGSAEGRGVGTADCPLQ
ncbi:MAG: type I restriction endonuclease [Planctomycetota bacterium]|nr:type I restriction endonuclease [Planctomycetota bacterium]